MTLQYQLCKTTFQLNTLSEEGTKIMVVGFCDKRESCWGLSGEEIRQEQSKDPDLKLILCWCRDQTKPSEGELFRSSAAAKFYWTNKERFLLRNNILFTQAKDSDQEYLV